MNATPFPNQPPPFEGRNLYLCDAALREAVARDAPRAEAALSTWGATLGERETYALADAANRQGPQLRSFDRRGERIDEVEFHPAWHRLMAMATQAGEHASPWSAPGPGAQVARAAMYLLHAQVENGTQCPLTMTYASVPALVEHGGAVPGLQDTWLPRIVANDYDPRSLPVGEKRAALIGMGMTERQGGSDVRTNLTRAEPAGGDTWRITGHKWFFSAPQCDAHLVLAQAPAGLTCFLLPRLLPDGSRNAIRLNRLKDKLGNRSNASAEVEFDDALAWRVGAEGRGIATILAMVQHTRLDCVLGSAGITRACVAWALHHAAHRIAFGRRLAEQPLMRNVLADLALESEAATVLALRLARAFEAPAGGPDHALARIATPAAKFWVCKRGPALAFEAMEVLGGNGYVEDAPLARFYRELPVNSIWEGSGNVMCLDVLRALRTDDAPAALATELASARGADRRYDDHVAALMAEIARRDDDAGDGRRTAQAIALALQASLLIRHAPPAIAAAFCGSRLGAGASSGGAVFGTLPPGIDTQAILDRAWPG